MFQETDSTPSFCSTILEDSGTVDHQTELDIKWVANSMYAGVSHFLVRVDRLEVTSYQYHRKHRQRMTNISNLLFKNLMVVLVDRL
jgi:hypothetical protein